MTPDKDEHARTNRATGSRVTFYYWHSFTYRLECLTHSRTGVGGRATEARRLVSRPWLWCEECQAARVARNRRGAA